VNEAYSKRLAQSTGVPRARRSVKRCAADPGSSLLQTRGPASALSLALGERVASADAGLERRHVREATKNVYGQIAKL
jgi:hypothetical protein